jgi:hypothetical protein
MNSLRLSSIRLILSLLITVTYTNNLHAKSEGYDADIPAERVIYTVKVNVDGSDTETREITYLARTQIAVESISQADIDYNSSTQTVKVLEAYTITPEGKKIPVAKNAIRTVEDDNSGGAAEFSDTKHRIIIFPNVKVGSRIYYKVRITTSAPLFQRFTTGFSFSPNHEYGHFELNLIHPAKMFIQAESNGVEGGRILDGPNKEVRYRYTYQNKNKVHPKLPLAVSYQDSSPSIRLSSYQSHIEFARIYEEKTKAMSAVTPTVQKLADQITLGITDPKEQARALYNWVSREIRYVAIYLKDGGFIPHYADSIIRNRYGDCKDNNTLLIALLAAKGIEASSALINASDSYTLPNLVTFGTFDHMITYLPQWDMYVDATQEFAPFGVLAFGELDKPTLLSSLGKIGRTQKPDAAQNKVSTRVTMTVDPEGKIRGTSHTLYSGVEDLEARPDYEGIGTVQEKKKIDDHLRTFRQIGTGKFIPSDPYDLNHPFEVKTEFSIGAITNMPGYGAMGVPVGLSPGELYIVSNKRSYEDFAPPYMCTSRTIEEHYFIEFPVNVKVTRVPQDITYKEGGIQYQSNYIQNGNKVEVKRSLYAQRPGAVCQAEELKQFNAFFPVFLSDMRSQIFYE